MSFLLYPALVALALLFSASSVLADNWPGWRGPTGVGATREKNLPLTWNGKTGENIVWKVKLPGQGNSSPIVWGEHVFVTTSPPLTREQEKEKAIPDHHIVCLSVADGSILWRAEVPHGSNHEGSDMYAVPTPVTDGKRIYAWFGSGVIAAVDRKGTLLWHHERPGPFNLNPGLCSSPILYKDAVILLCDQGGGKGFLQALRKDTGEVKWEQKRKDMGHNNTTPILVDVDGKPQLVVAGSKAIQGLDPTDGSVIWSCAARAFGASPAFGAGLVYVDSGTDGPAVVVAPTGRGDVSKSHVRWQVKKQLAEYASPVISGDYVYRTRRPGMLQCWKVASGEEVFTERLEGITTLASPIATADGRVYFIGSGKSYVIQAGPKFEQLAVNDLRGGNTGASPAVADGRIFVRDRETLWCIGKK